MRGNCLLKVHSHESSLQKLIFIQLNCHLTFKYFSFFSTNVTLVDLCPYTMYRVSVAAATGAGNGSFSDHSDSRTFGAIPEFKVQLRGLRKMCPSGLLVEWEELRSKVLYGPIEDIFLVVNYTSLESGVSNATKIKYYTGNTVSD